MAANTYGRQVVVPLTNKSGGGVIAGDVVIVDTSNNDAFTTTTSAGSTGGVGIAQETIASNAVGRVLTQGYAALVNVNASVTRGNYGATHTVAKQAAGQASRGTGTFCQFLTGGTTPDALVFPVDLLGTSLTNPMTNVGDIIYGGTAGTPTRLADVATGSVLISGGVNTAPAWGYPTLIVADAAVGANVGIGGSAYTDIVSLALGAGTWDVWAYAAVANGGTIAQLYCQISDNSNNQLAQSPANIAASREETIPILAPGVAGSQTIKLRVFSTQTGNVEGTTAIGSPGGGSKIHAVRVA